MSSKNLSWNLHVAGFVPAETFGMGIFSWRQVAERNAAASLSSQHDSYENIICSRSLPVPSAVLWQRALQAALPFLMCSLAAMPLSKHCFFFLFSLRAAGGRRKTTLTSGPEAARRRWQRLFHFSLWRTAARLKQSHVNRSLQVPASYWAENMFNINVSFNDVTVQLGILFLLRYLFYFYLFTYV